MLRHVEASTVSLRSPFRLVQKAMHRFTIEHKISNTLLGATYVCRFNTAQPTHHRSPLVLKCSSLATRNRLATMLATDTIAALDDPLRERDVVAALIATGGHDHVLQYYDHFTTEDEVTGDKRVCIVMEYCDGGDLFSYLPPSGGVGENTAISLMLQVACGVLFVQTHVGLAHRDLSLENVFLRDGLCKVADFGLATPLHERCHRRVGKQLYMAPEVVASSAEGYDPAAADVWSLGVMLFIMLTGCTLLNVASPEDPRFVVLMQRGVGGIITAWGLEVSRPVVELMALMLDVDPTQRPTVRQLVVALNRLGAAE